MQWSFCKYVCTASKYVPEYLMSRKYMFCTQNTTANWTRSCMCVVDFHIIVHLPQIFKVKHQVYIKTTWLHIELSFTMALLVRIWWNRRACEQWSELATASDGHMEDFMRSIVGHLRRHQCSETFSETKIAAPSSYEVDVNMAEKHKQDFSTQVWKIQPADLWRYF